MNRIQLFVAKKEKVYGNKNYFNINACIIDAVFDLNQSL